MKHLIKTVVVGIVVAGVVALAGCDNLPFGEIHDAKQAVKYVLVDEDSAKFRNMRIVEELDSVCGEVNSRNRAGGYTGYVPFGVSDSEVVIYSDDKPNPVKMLCNLAFATYVNAPCKGIASGDANTLPRWGFETNPESCEHDQGLGKAERVSIFDHSDYTSVTASREDGEQRKIRKIRFDKTDFSVKHVCFTAPRDEQVGSEHKTPCE